MLKITEVAPALLGGVAELERAVFREPWSEKALALLCGDSAFGFAVTEGERVLAYGGMVTVLDEGQITNVATHPEARRQGLGAMVLAALLEGARARGLAEVTLEVRETNSAAIALYTRFGFTVVGKRPHFYTHPDETALVMKCEIGK